MLEFLPNWLGGLLHNVRAGHAKLLIVDPELAVGDATISLTSPAFANGARLPERFTADGEGNSPPLTWGALPEGTASVLLIVEDPDAPAFQPLLHALMWNMPADQNFLPEGSFNASDDAGLTRANVGGASVLSQGWVPPDPPPGHGPHDYVFQLFALAEPLQLDDDPDATGVKAALLRNVLACGMLVGTFSRGEETPLPPLGFRNPSLA